MTAESMEKAEGKLSFKVKADAQAFEKAVNEVYREAKKDIYIPGFRKGKAPRAVVEGMYGKDVFHDDAVAKLAPELYEQAKKDITERVVGRPSIEGYEVGEDKSVEVRFSVALYPEVTVGEYKGLEVYKAPVEVTDAELDEEIERTRKKNGRIVTVEREIRDGDTANIDYDGYLNGKRFNGGKDEGYDLVIGSGTFVPGFEEQLIGLKAGEEKDIDITFPENYHAELAGKAVVFKVKINEVKETQLPELDDEFAKDVSEFDTLEEYKASVRDELLKSKTSYNDMQFKNDVMAKAVEGVSVELPDVMVDEQLDFIVEDYARNCSMQGMSFEAYLGSMGMDERTFRSIMRPQAVNSVKMDVLLDKVAELEGIEVSEDEIEEEYKKFADSYKMELDEIKSRVDAEVVRRDIIMRKASEVIYDSAVATDKQEEAPAADESAEKAAEQE